MGQSSVRGEGTRNRVPRARKRGRDDSPHDEGGSGDGGPSDAGAAGGPDAAPRPGTARAQARPGTGRAGGGPGRRRRSTPAGATGGRRPAPRAAKGGRRRVLRWSAAVLSLLILGTAGAGYLYYQHLNGNIRSGERSGGDSGVRKAAPNAAGNTPLNILLIGSDSRNTAANLELGGSRDSVGSKPRADVQMLLHVSADRRNASVISIPRDTRVTIPECRDPKTGETFRSTTTIIINETLARGGPGCTLTTWESLTGVYIDHWMMVDFAGVVKMADAVGGVPVCVNQGVWDRPTAMVKGGSGLKLRAGTTEVRGEDALKWLRTRHAFANDQGRARAQHMYMNSLLRKLKEQNAFTDTGRIMDLAEAGTKALEVSAELGTVKDLFDLAMELKDVPTNRITMTTLPTDEYSGNRNHLVPVERDAARLWKMLREDVAFDSNGKPADAARKPAPRATGPAAAAPGSLIVTVVNGTGGNGEGSVKGRAAAVVEFLQSRGFTRATAAQAAAPATDTVLAYPKAGGARSKADALSVAKVLGVPNASVRASGEVAGLTLTVGADWREGVTYPKAQTPRAGDLPENADALNATDKSCMDVYAPYRWNGA
ncbi:LCP family protein [Streptomyces sp. NPDC050856]|uniref:LCP family protein n=1 Tax=Streptomyces sp. NPDC050856 TaxID=3154939 RepID=UPI00340EBFF1